MRIDILLIKSIITTVTALIGNSMGMLVPTLMLLIILMIVDYISGMLAAKKEAIENPYEMQYRWSSKKSIIGIYKKVGYILTILVAVSTDYLIYKFADEMGGMPVNNTIFGLLVSVWFILNELISILENANRMGAVIPHFLQRLLLEIKKDVEDKSEP